MNKDDYLKIQQCKHCGLYDYWGEFRWKNGQELCRRCYKAEWEQRNGHMYKWNDWPSIPFPSEREIHERYGTT